MNENINFASEFVNSAVASFRANKGWADKAIAQLQDDKLHIALDENTNSIAVIMKHVGGNLTSRWTHFLTTDGEKPWRNRDDEFVDSFASRQEVLTHWEEGWNLRFEALATLQPEDLSKSVTIRGEVHSVPLAVHRSLTHVAYHIGQLIMVARILAGEKWEMITIHRGESASFNQSVWAEGDDQPSNERKTN